MAQIEEIQKLKSATTLALLGRRLLNQRQFGAPNERVLAISIKLERIQLQVSNKQDSQSKDHHRNCPQGRTFEKNFKYPGYARGLAQGGCSAAGIDSHITLQFLRIGFVRENSASV